MTERFKRELKKLLDYAQPEEEWHYEESDSDEKRRHIVHSIRYLRKSLEKNG